MQELDWKQKRNDGRLDLDQLLPVYATTSPIECEKSELKGESVDLSD